MYRLYIYERLYIYDTMYTVPMYLFICETIRNICERVYVAKNSIFMGVYTAYTYMCI